MTIEEKRQAIEKHCHTKELCSRCELYHCEGRCHNINLSDGEIENNYAIVFGNIEEPIKPEYYNDTKITPFDVIDDWELNFYLGNAIKYIKRAGKKADNSKLQDLKKVREYIDHEIKVEEARE